MKALRLFVIPVALALPGSLSAQETALPSTTAAASGVVFDSLRLRPLSGAIVRLDSSDVTATADENGRFRLEGIRPGPHFLRVEHPVLDTLTLSLRSPVVNYTAGTVAVVDLATPSAETLVAHLCTAAWRSRGPAALVGRVSEADSEKPAVGAKVSLVWYELEVATGLKRVPRVREATVGPDGVYRICGLPAQLDGKVQVIRGALTSGEITLSFGEVPLHMRSMSIAAPGAAVVVTTPGDSGAPRQVEVLGTARLTGRVLSGSGRPLPGARVQLEGTSRATVTRANGEFTLDSLPAGTQNVGVRLLGYAPTEAAVDLSSREPATVTVQMTEFVPVLEAVRVTAARERALDAVGFSRRQRTGQGYYMDEEDINENSQYFSDVLRNAPGIRITQAQGRQMIMSTRSTNGCVQVFIDGSPWQQLEPGDIDDFVRPHELAAIEVYSSSTTPAEFQTPRGGSCTTIVAWTYRRLDRDRRR